MFGDVVDDNYSIFIICKRDHCSSAAKLQNAFYVFADDSDPLAIDIGAAVPELAFDGLFGLATGRVAGVYNGVHNRELLSSTTSVDKIIGVSVGIIVGDMDRSGSSIDETSADIVA